MSGALESLIPPHRRWMKSALREAEIALEEGEVPVGAVVVRGDQVVGRGHNMVERLQDPTAHAELIAITAAASTLGSKHLEGCTLYVTLEPCPMCAAAIGLARIRRLYFAAYDPKGGGVEHGPRIFDQPTCHHRPDVYGGIDEVRAGAMLRQFFTAKR